MVISAGMGGKIGLNLFIGLVLQVALTLSQTANGNGALTGTATGIRRSQSKRIRPFTFCRQNSCPKISNKYSSRNMFPLQHFRTRF
jgi:hypothetical protein